MNKAWFFGDSFTYGSGCTPSSPYYKNFPEKRAKLWTTLVSEHFNLKEENCGIPGSSIPLILSTVIKNLHLISEGDYVFLSDTAITRFLIPTTGSKEITSALYKKPENIKPGKHIDACLDYITYCIVPYQQAWEQYYFSQYDSIRKVLNKNKVNVLFWSYLIWSGEKKFHTIAQDTNGEVRDGHFSWKGHEDMSKLILSMPFNSPIGKDLI